MILKTVYLDELGKTNSIGLEVELRGYYTDDRNNAFLNMHNENAIEFHIREIKVTEYGNASDIVKRCQNPKWFEWLDDYAEGIIRAKGKAFLAESGAVCYG